VLRLVVAVALAAVVVGARIGGAAPAAGAAGTANSGTFAGQVDIGGGRKLYLRCAGRGSPTVILESGIHDSSDLRDLTQTTAPVLASPSVFSGLARSTHVCRYDRPGTIRQTTPISLTTRSTPVRMPRTLPSMVADLQALVQRAGLRGPFVLVAHSDGGMIARLFAQTHPSEVAGMVLVDAFGTNIKRLFGRLWPRYEALLNHPGTPLDSSRGFETVDADEAIRAIDRARPLPRIPLAVISKGEPFATTPGTPKDLTAKLEQVWPAVQRLLVTLEPRTPQTIATGSHHYVQVPDPDLTIAIVRLILARVRGH
jgi:pimeloyl-ACP methyl ester carboxylesterase